MNCGPSAVPVLLVLPGACDLRAITRFKELHGILYSSFFVESDREPGGLSLKIECDHQGKGIHCDPTATGDLPGRFHCPAVSLRIGGTVSGSDSGLETIGPGQVPLVEPERPGLFPQRVAALVEQGSGSQLASWILPDSRLSAQRGLLLSLRATWEAVRRPVLSDHC